MYEAGNSILHPQSTAGNPKTLERGYSDGDEIDPWFFQHLIDCGDLYTGNSGWNESVEIAVRPAAQSGRTWPAETEDPLAV